MTQHPAAATSIAAFRSAFDAVRCIDLTHRMEPGMPVWPGHPVFTHMLLESYDKGDVSCHYALAFGEHTGTHVDAPRHFFGAAAGGWSIDAAPEAQFFSRLATLGATDVGPRGLLGAEHILAWEAVNGPIEAGDAVFFHFGWDRLWDDPAMHAAFLADWPGLSRAASELLVARRVRLVASDCLALDCFGNADFPAHHVLLGAGIMIGENFARLGELPPVCFGAVVPLPVAEGSGSPVRALAFVPRA